MTTRTQERIVRFRHSFRLANSDRPLPPGEYRVVSEEEPIGGLSFLAYRTTFRSIVVPLRKESAAPADRDDTSSVEMIPLSLEELERALEQDRHDGLNA